MSVVGPAPAESKLSPSGGTARRNKQKAIIGTADADSSVSRSNFGRNPEYVVARVPLTMSHTNAFSSSESIVRIDWKNFAKILPFDVNPPRPRRTYKAGNLAQWATAADDSEIEDSDGFWNGGDAETARELDGTHVNTAQLKTGTPKPTQLLQIKSSDNVFPTSFVTKHQSRERRITYTELKKPYTAPPPRHIIPFIPQKARTANVESEHREHIASLRSKLKKPVPTEIEETPPELDYETRPRSAHVPFRLEDHVKKTTMFVEKEPEEDYERKMRSLFLPSLFAGDGVDDMKEEKRRKRLDGTNVSGRTNELAKPPAVPVLGNKSVTFQETGEGLKQTAGQFNRKASLRSSPSRPQSGQKHKSNTRARSAGKRNSNPLVVQQTAPTSIPQRSLATLDSNDDVPSDIPASALRWTQAIFHVLKSNKLKRQGLEDPISGFESEDSRFARARRDKLDLIGALRVKKVYEINISNRTDKDLDVLDTILGKYRCFSKLSPVVRYKLYNCCTVETHSRGTVMIREGHQARYWYIILAGECVHQLRPDTPMTITSRVQVGGSVGDFATSYGTLSSQTETRHVRATCLMRTMFLRVEKQDFVAISREARGLDTMVYEYFTTVPAFFGVEKAVLNALCQRSIVRNFPADHVMLRAGDYCSNLYFVMKGRIRALHMVTFVKVDHEPASQSCDRRHKYTLSPFRFPHTASKLGKSDEIVRELAAVLDITPGMSFPPMKPSKVVAEQQEAAAMAEAQKLEGRRTSIMPAVKPASHDVHAMQTPFHFVVVDKADVVVISFADLIEILPVDILRRVMEHRTMTDVSTQEIEERYLSALGWRDTDNGGKRALKIDSFSNDSSWSHPVVPNKFKKGHDENEGALNLLDKERGLRTLDSESENVVVG
ncbi:hypothetical protein HDU83_006637 [Entophlyctis luteolus]|nr:hypothetical protein HDU83_006637 [Entophlyctis luteolus]